MRGFPAGIEFSREWRNGGLRLSRSARPGRRAPLADAALLAPAGLLPVIAPAAGPTACPVAALARRANPFRHARRPTTADLAGCRRAAASTARGGSARRERCRPPAGGERRRARGIVHPGQEPPDDGLRDAAEDLVPALAEARLDPVDDRQQLAVRP